MSLTELLADFRADASLMANLAAWRTLPATPAVQAETPVGLDSRLCAVLAQRGIHRLYSHQAAAVEVALDGDNAAVVTPTASGKTLCYNLPVLHSLLADAQSRALYLFPTKALAQDQLAELTAWSTALGQAGGDDGPLLAGRPLAATYDGDTPLSRRSSLRRDARILLSNPDMLHAGILPYHPQWDAFLGGLRYVVIDEMHVYRGVFGSHVANVLRRLQRLCAYYGSRPQFILASATIANPQQLAEQLIEQPVTVIDRNGAPQGEKHVLLYNPPVYDHERGLRRSSTLEAQELAVRCINAGLQTIVFGRSRLTTEILLGYVRDKLAQQAGGGVAAARIQWADTAQELQQTVRGYRGGYLPTERRAIEAGLRAGTVRAVVTTNALELGIDIGQLQAAILCGYPGSIAAAWQQMGRAGRTREASLAILVATGGVLDQYVLQTPDFLFERSPEHALINADNLMLLVDQVRCAVFELPFRPGERFGRSTFTADVLDLLAEQGDVSPAAGRTLWQGEGYPARAVSLRSAGSDSVVIQAEPPTGPYVIGEVDAASAPLLVHTGAVYWHQGASYLVDHLDLDAHLATVTPAQVDFYTEVNTETDIQVLAQHDSRQAFGLEIAHGDVLVTTQLVGFRRVKRFTHETIGIQPLEFPPQIVETSAYWLQILPETQARLAHAGQWYDSVNDYGPTWQGQRQKVRARDGYRCTRCGASEAPNRQHDVHHLIPFRTFGYVPGVNEHDKLANRLENLVLVCRTCHQRLESTVRVRTGLDGLSYALSNLAPLHLMCDRADLGVSVVRGDAAQAAPGPSAPPKDAPLPAIYIYERVAAGLGFSARLYELHDLLIHAAHELVQRCSCPRGCPACVGPVLENEQAQLATKQLVLALLQTVDTSANTSSAPSARRVSGGPPVAGGGPPDEVDFDW